MQNHTQISINMPRLLVNLSTSLDFSYQGITDHHKRVAALSIQLAYEGGLRDDQISQVFQSAIIHDIGAMSWSEKSGLTAFELEASHQHCIKGASLLGNTKTLSTAKEIILCHHDQWQGSNYSGLTQDAIPLISRIIHLADRLDILINPAAHILQQRDHILKRLALASGTSFDPGLVSLLEKMGQRESFWLELVSPWMDESLMALPLWQTTTIDLDELFDLANLFAGVIDYKSPFTHRHSRGVSMVSKCLARKAGLTETDTSLLAVAALLHDIGKLSVPDNVLEKPGSLSQEEMCLIKQHSFYTYKILQPLAPATKIPQWAALHHEKLNGHGYPFGCQEDQLDLPSRIVVIADIFSALHEDRPYRNGLTWEIIMKILDDEIQQNYIDADLCTLLWDNRQEIENCWQAL